jgi:hypothetical protein
MRRSIEALANVLKMPDDTSSNRILGVDQKYVFAVIFLMMLLPYLWFLADSFRRMESILGTIGRPPATEAQNILSNPTFLQLDPARLDVISRTALERDTMHLRNHRANTSLSTRTWLRFMSVIFGAILVLIGSAFVLGRVSMERLESEAKSEKWSIALKTSSPGLLLALMGSSLIALPHFAHQDINISDSGAYFGVSYPAATQTKQVSDPVTYEKERDEAIRKAIESTKKQ